MTDIKIDGSKVVVKDGKNRTLMTTYVDKEKCEPPKDIDIFIKNSIKMVKDDVKSYPRFLTKPHKDNYLLECSKGEMEGISYNDIIENSSVTNLPRLGKKKKRGVDK